MAFFPPQAISLYANFAAFPSASFDGALGLALDTDDLYAYNLATTTWRLVGGPGVALSLGNIDAGSASATQGASIVAGILYMQSASATVPGLVNTAAQTFAGVKTLTSAILITPNLGTPSAGILTNCTGLPVSTGIAGLGTGIATWLATPSSANLLSAMTTSTGTGNLCFATSPTLATPILGTPTSGTLTNCTGLPVSSGISGLGTGIATWLATPSSANLLSAMTTSTGSGNLCFATSPVLVTPNIGTPSAGVLTSCSGLPLTTGVTGTLPIGNGGTNQTTASAAFNGLSPITTTGDMIYSASGATNSRLAIGSTGNVLTVAGGVPSWAAPATNGTVTSVAMSVPAFLSISGSPITTSGTLALTLSGTALPVANGGTGVTASTGTTNAVLSNGPTLVAPVLGTPASGNLSNCTAYPVVVPGTTAGLVSSSGVTGNTSGSTISAGFVGQVISSLGFGAGITVSTSQTQLGTISPTAGVWLIYATLSVNQGVLAATNYSTWCLGTTTASTSGTTIGYSQKTCLVSVGSGYGSDFLAIQVSLGSTTPYYLNAASNQGGSASGDFVGSLVAIRIA